MVLDFLMQFFFFFLLILTYFESSGKSIVASKIILLSFPGKISTINRNDLGIFGNVEREIERENNTNICRLSYSLNASWMKRERVNRSICLFNPASLLSGELNRPSN